MITPNIKGVWRRRARGRCLVLVCAFWCFLHVLGVCCVCDVCACVCVLVCWQSRVGKVAVATATAPLITKEIMTVLSSGMMTMQRIIVVAVAVVIDFVFS